MICPVMIRKILLCLALCGSIPAAAQKITGRPSCEVQTSGVTTIEKIEQTDDCTRPYVHAFRGNWLLDGRYRQWVLGVYDSVAVYDKRLDYTTGIFYLDNTYAGEDFL